MTESILDAGGDTIAERVDGGRWYPPDTDPDGGRGFGRLVSYGFTAFTNGMIDDVELGLPGARVLRR